MQTVKAHEKLSTRVQSRPSAVVKPVVELKSTHAAECPICGQETRILAGDEEAHAFGSCAHLVRVERQADAVSVIFDESPRRARAAVALHPSA